MLRGLINLGLARLVPQERAYMMLSAHGGDGSEYDASDAGSYDYYDEEEEGIEGDEGSDYEEEGVLPNDEDEELGDAEGAELDPARYEDDEAYARALQDAEEREVAQRLMALAGITDCACRRQDFSKFSHVFSESPFGMLISLLFFQ